MVLECFINKLAQVCDNVPFGDTVTSVAITVHNYDGLLYILASNRQTAGGANQARDFVRRLLDDMGSASSDQVKDDPHSPLFHKALRQILEFHDKRVQAYRDKLLKSATACIVDCDANDSSDSMVRAIIIARRRIPELFENFNIIFLPSSNPLPNPITCLQPSTMTAAKRRSLRTAKAIIGRMVWEPAELAKYQGYAEELQRCGLDDLIFKQSGIQVRRGHKNVYLNWIVPNVTDESPEWAKEKDSLIDKVLRGVRRDALSALEEKVTDHKRWDSDTFSYQQTFQSLASTSVRGTDLASVMSLLSIAEAGPSRRSQRSVIVDDDSWSVAGHADHEAEAEDSDDDGGALLYSGRRK
ncbi:hypothetical protein K4K54_002857 [Colletotrichum sp. SAR 10_86]|nr:hypothetical protein KHU50_002086 [Colletotrichum sp. SAR 10_65]KAI8192067.1 hypothetical protein K4K51_008526 [Colletotrichum sp. SAR 10_75]KAI8236545.1 hypothetical protein K4K54_002857 [Colletotrichum sp. SAR 10_86]KAI8264817.1 hypothetical protein K4K53_000102 [Colletotrichum sp. SAR 10_77]